MITDAEILNELGTFTNHEAEIFRRYRHNRLFARGERIVGPGSLPQSIYLLKRGAVMQYQQVNDRERQYENLFAKRGWFFDLGIFKPQTPVSGVTEAFTDCEVIELTLNSVHQLINASPAFLALNKIFYPVTERLNFLSATYSPAEKYGMLIRSQPEIIRTFPLKAIASYLRISPETLSRVRAKA
jgi:Cyclic nucleotide-binding domain